MLLLYDDLAVVDQPDTIPLFRKIIYTYNGNL